MRRPHRWVGLTAPQDVCEPALELGRGRVTLDAYHAVPLSPQELPTHEEPQPRGPRRPMERAAPQEGHRRMVPVRDPRHRRSAAPSARSRSPTRTWATASRSAVTASSKAADFPDQTGESVLVQGRNGLKVDRPAVHRRRPRRRVAARADEGRPQDREPARRRGYAGNVSKDGRSMLVNFQLPGDLDAAEKRVDASLATTAALQRAHPGGDDRAVRRRVGGQGPEQGARRRLQEGRVPLPPHHAR